MVIVIPNFFTKGLWPEGKTQMILRLKNDYGMWIDNLQDIATKFAFDYKA